MARPLWEKIRTGAPLSLPVRMGLRALVPFYRCGMLVRLRRTGVSVDARVISIGNLTVGGTGKTPAVIERAQRAVAEGHTVGILTRGYGTPQAEAPVVGRWEDSALEVETFGDEPVLIGRSVPEAYIVKGKDRVRGARVACELGCDTLILDDGFQYTPLQRDEDIVLIDASNPFGNGFLLPRGILREPVSALSRATEVVLTRCDQAADLAGLRAVIARHAPGTPIRMTRHAPTHLFRASSGEDMGPVWLEGREVVAACALGNPDGFFSTLGGLGAVVQDRRQFVDHGEIAWQNLPGDIPVIITEKDAVKGEKLGDNVFVLRVALQEIEIED